MKTRKKEIILDKKYILSFLRSNKKLMNKKYNVKKIGLFGSYARDEAKKRSDIDIVIAMTEVDALKLLLLKDFLEKKFNKEVNIVTFDGLRTFIKRHIQEDIIYA